MTARTAKARFVSIVTPMFGESGAIDVLLPALRENLDIAGVNSEIIVVDDGSGDDTWEKLRQSRSRFPELRAARFSRNFGKEAAVRAGIDMARGDAVIVMDSDMQHPPALIPEMIRLWTEEGAEIVEGVKRNREADSVFQRSMSKSFNKILFWLSGMDMTSSTDFRLLDRRVVDAFMSMDERNAFFRGMTTWLGFNRRQIEFDVPPRVAGKTTWSTFGLAKLAIRSIGAFSATPLYLVHIIGAVFLIFAVGLSAQTLYNKFYGGAASGFTTVIIVLLVIGSAVMFSLGIIGDYIGRIYTEVQRRPRYVVSERIETEQEARELEGKPLTFPPARGA